VWDTNAITESRAAMQQLRSTHCARFHMVKGGTGVMGGWGGWVGGTTGGQADGPQEQGGQRKARKAAAGMWGWLDIYIGHGHQNVDHKGRRQVLGMVSNRAVQGVHDVLPDGAK
jgi:hypothetical protein